MIKRCGVLAVTSVFLLASSCANAHDEDAKAPGGNPVERLGKVEFPNSCGPAVQEKFLRGVAMLHSFWYSEAEKTF
jgi:hypothetical protein